MICIYVITLSFSVMVDILMSFLFSMTVILKLRRMDWWGDNLERMFSGENLFLLIYDLVLL